MKLSEIKRNVEAIEQGTWVGAKYGTPIPGMGDLCIKTRGAGNSDWKQLEDKLLQAAPAVRRIAGLSRDDRDAITAQCLLNCGTTDWSGIEGDDNQPVPYSKAQAELFFTDRAYEDLRNAALYAANIVGTAAAESLKVDAKN